MVVGYRAPSYARPDFTIARFNPDGTLDPTFGVDGWVTKDFAGSDDRATAAAIDASQRIVVGGNAFTGSEYEFAIARYNPDGSLDPSFDGDGTVLTDVGGSGEWVALAIDGAGRLLQTGAGLGTEVFDFVTARHNIDGTLDLGFGGGDGIVRTDFAGPYLGDEATAVALDRSGNVFVAGYATIPRPGYGPDRNFAVVRYSNNGTLDTTFGDGGKVTTDFMGWGDEAHAMTVDGLGRVILAGSAAVGGHTDFALARYVSLELKQVFLPLILR